MKEVQAPVTAIALSSRRIHSGGVSGRNQRQIYRQFALTIAASVLLSPSTRSR